MALHGELAALGYWAKPDCSVPNGGRDEIHHVLVTHRNPAVERRLAPMSGQYLTSRCTSGAVALGVDFARPKWTDSHHGAIAGNGYGSRIW